MKKYNKESGTRGEEIAADYLTRKGYRILERNFTSDFGEIDIIAEKDNALVFVEVKYRTSQLYGEPYEAVNARKLYKLRRMVDYYYTIRHPSKSPKIEVVSITGEQEETRIKHIHTIIF